MIVIFIFIRVLGVWFCRFILFVRLGRVEVILFFLGNRVCIVFFKLEKFVVFMMWVLF